MTVSFDGLGLRIIIDDIADLDAGGDIYSEWKEWVKLSDNAKFYPAFDTTGGDPTRPGQTISPYFFLRNDLGWRIRAPEADGEVTIVGNLFARDASIPVQVPSLGNFNTLIRLEISPQSLTVFDPDAAHLLVAFDGTTIQLGVWLDRFGTTVLNPVSCQVDWYVAATDALLFTTSDSDPDARGHFDISVVQGLLANEAYYCDVFVTDVTGTQKNRRGVPTVGP